MLAPDVVERLKAAAERAFHGRRVLAAQAFGSGVSGLVLPSSDLDVAYYLEGHRQGERLLADAPLELRGRVLEEGVRIYSGDAAARVALERDQLARYHDYKDEFREMHETRLRAVASRGLQRDLVRRHPLRAYAAVHLASALELKAALEEPMTFVAADARLLEAARHERLDTLAPEA